MPVGVRLRAPWPPEEGLAYLAVTVLGPYGGILFFLSAVLTCMCTAHTFPTRIQLSEHAYPKILGYGGRLHFFRKNNKIPYSKQYVCASDRGIDLLRLSSFEFASVAELQERCRVHRVMQRSAREF